MPVRKLVVVPAALVIALLMSVSLLSAQPALPPVITLWYGNAQTFGARGNPVPDINILGNVTAGAGIASLSYTLNGGAPRTLSVGPDTRRLKRPGDFNADIPTTSLVPGTNRVVITAVDNLTAVDRETVMVNYVANQTWPLPYTITWGTAAGINDVAQVVDGKWTLESGGLRVVEPGYDRFVAIGDRIWSDYDITVPVTVFSIDSSGFQYPSNGCGVGFLMRWPGHSDLPASLAGWQPRTGFLPLGALSLYEWHETGSGGKITGNGLSVLDQDSSGFHMQFNTEYIFRMRVETVPGVGGRYRMKIWPSGSVEPATWLLDGQEEATDPQKGCLLLAAHNVNARFGNPTVTPIVDAPASSLVSDDFSAPAINSGLWTLRNPAGDATFSLTGTYTADARLAIDIPAGNAHEPWTGGNGAVRAVQPAGSGNFEVETKFDAPLTVRYQMQGVEVLHHDSTYMRFEFFSDGTSTRAFVATLVDNIPTTRLNVVVGPQGIAPLSMRIRRVGDGWTMLYSRDGAVWTVATTFTYALNATGIGPYAGNAGIPAPAFTGLVDYFFNTALPIVPEDSLRRHAPVIVTGPSDATVSPGQTATFGVSATGIPAPTYQWKKNGTAISGATDPSYTTPPAVAGDDGALFRCVVTNISGSVESGDAILHVVSDGPRVLDGIVALYTFDEGSGAVVHDVSGVSPALDLTITQPARVVWGSGSLDVRRNTLIRSASAARKIVNAAKASRELTIEAWITPENDNWVGRIIGNADNQTPRHLNFTLNQRNGRYVGRVRTTTTWLPISRAVRTPNHSVHEALTHLVYTRNAAGRATIYIDGVEVAHEQVAGTFANWDASHRLSLANDLSSNKPWKGTFHLVAIYARALTAAQVVQNFAAGANPVMIPVRALAVENGVLPRTFALEQNYPNPFNPLSTIEYRVAEQTRVTLTVYDLLGRTVATLVDEERAPGIYASTFDASGLASGTYLYRLTAGRFTETRKMMLVK
jgi:hypothetical protein